MNKKKILWIAILILFIVAIVVVAIMVKPKDTSTNKTSTVSRGSKNTVANKQDDKNKKDKSNNSTYQKKELSDGILYSKNSDIPKADVVLKDKYFDTTISDMNINPDKYLGKVVEVEGLYFSNELYTFVGRYTTSNMCADCPPGCSYIEYEWDSKIDKKLTSEKDWIKVIGTFSKGTDNVGTEEEPEYTDYYYLKAVSLEIMNEKGQETVNN